MISSSRSVPLALTVCLLSLSLAPAAQAAAPSLIPQVGPNFQYGSAVFDKVAQTSYKTVNLAGSFDDWITAAYPKSGTLLGTTGSLTADLDAHAAAMQLASGDVRIKLERETAAWAHTFIKKSIPKFSLERGFELASVVRTGGSGLES